ncbi:MAG: 50S ribosomal protein L13 [Candidatus Omnitrophica bacterium]|nr:50S ribosomal protein L13 [Candidatus Omnitrophota bacterium]
MEKVKVKKTETKELKWHVIDAKDKILGRLAVQVAKILMGKDKPEYVPYIAGGDGVIVINAGQVKVTGAKLSQKLYTYYSGYPDGLRKVTLGKMMENRPCEVIRHAVKGMLPRNRLGSVMISRLKVYADEKHKHEAQSPNELK